MKEGADALEQWRVQWEHRWPGELMQEKQTHVGRLAFHETRLGRAEVLERMARYFAEDTDFQRKNHHPLAVFVTQIDRYGPPAPSKKLTAMAEGTKKFLAQGQS